MVISDMCYNGFTASPSVGRSSDFMMLVKSVLLLHWLFYTSLFFCHRALLWFDNFK